MLVVAVLVEGHEKIGLVAGREHVAGAHADLEDGGAAGDRGGDGHVGHDLLLAASRQAGQKRAGALDAILGIARQADHRVADALRSQVGPSCSG